MAKLLNWLILDWLEHSDSPSRHIPMRLLLCGIDVQKFYFLQSIIHLVSIYGLRDAYLLRCSKKDLFSWVTPKLTRFSKYLEFLEHLTKKIGPMHLNYRI